MIGKNQTKTNTNENNFSPFLFILIALSSNYTNNTAYTMLYFQTSNY
jgi:hypothetical protein